MPAEVIDVCLALGRNDHPHNGLAEFSRQLVTRLIARAHERVRFRYQAREGLKFETVLEREFGAASERIRPLSLGRLDRWLDPGWRGLRLWHTLNQYALVRPPRGVASLVTIHDLNYRYSGGANRRRRGDLRIARALAQHDRVVSISHHTARDLRTVFDRESEVIHNGATSLVGLQRRTPVEAPEPGYVFHLSRMSPDKNTAPMLDLVRSWPEQRFVFAGPRSSDTEALAATLRTEHLDHARVLFDISEQEKAWLFAHAGAFLFPSLCEGFGLPVIEAMHFGVPVCVSNLTSLPEVAGEEAFYVEQFDPCSMRSAVEAALASSGMGERARARREHAARFDWDRAARAYCAVYNDLLGEEAFDVG